MITALAVLVILLMLCSLALHIFGLPANWILLAFVIGWKIFLPETMSWNFISILAVIALIGEILEFAAQYFGGKKYGATGRGSLGAFIGAIAGAILGAPFFFGLGALPGALLGSFGGCLVLELSHGRSFAEAQHSAWGAFWGKAFGLAIKVSLGVWMFTMSIPKIWPS
ncbi:DUF456 domain-containing protein [Maridesulfovibrio ferrireducens]|uniref:DUF456 domain-containing protein n=1 Tax=Maridesulfovibrio ferrireducens TaxID=246191 RepID=UPI001A341DF6|nr:DUF456 domain-containing protein [Maridesulfovibrio ferrireducens]MBI9111344.1 DUF456 domain-containing protein [Maridesulfovibrio ferrireducens]